MKVVITGGTGLVGSNIIRMARNGPDVEVIATVFSRQPEVPWGIATIPVGLADAVSVRQAIEAHGLRVRSVSASRYPR